MGVEKSDWKCAMAARKALENRIKILKIIEL